MYLNRNLASEVLALRQIDDAHSAFAEHPHQTIGAGFFEGRNQRAVGNATGDLPDITIEQRFAPILVEHAMNLGQKLAVLAAGVLEELSPLVLPQIRGVVEQLLDAFPAGRIH